MRQPGPLRILTLLARRGEARYADAVSRMDELFKRKVPGIARETVVIDNALPSGPVDRTSSGWALIGGDNRAWEFSAWDEALCHVGRDLDAFDVVHLTTSAFGMLNTEHLERFDEALLRLVAERPLATGHVDYYPHAVEVGSRVSQHWLRTSFVFVAPREIRTLRTLVSYADKRDLFSGDPGRPFREGGPVSEGYARLIVDWLTSPDGTGQGVVWHSRMELNSETLPHFEDKALAILNEHALSARLRAQGCAVVDLSHLALLVARGTVPRTWPSWRQQVTDRGNASHSFPPARPSE